MSDTIKYIVTEQGKKLLAQGIDILPRRGTKYSAGMDLSAAIDEPIEIRPKEVVKIYTGIKVYLGSADEAFEDSETDMNLCGFYLPRGSNKNLRLENTVGLLDYDFQGESFLKVKNDSDEEIITIKPGDKLAQLVIVPAIMFPWEQTEVFEQTTERGEGGDGSTGGNFTHG